MGWRVGVVGGSGYAGGELLRLVAGHPHLELVTVAAHGQAGQAVRTVHPGLRSLADVVFTETSPDRISDLDLVFLALPSGSSGPLAERLPSTIRVVDLSGDHRLTDPSMHARYYGGQFFAPWTYGLPELPGQRERIAAARRVANTGCYAAATILAVAPLVAAEVAQPDDVVVVAASGTSGAGRSLQPGLLASEVMGDLTPYKVGVHQHVPEIKQAAGIDSLTFVPVLAPMPRGILATVTMQLRRPADVDELRTVLAAAYAGEPFVDVLESGSQPHTGATLGSNSAHLQVAIDADSGRVVVTCAIDNLGKGAAGQAVQNANLMLGLPEPAGLAADGITP